MADAGSANQLFELWRKQFEEGAQAWTRLVGQAPTPPAPDPTAFWRPVLDQGVQTWAKLFAQTPATPELLTQWKQFIDQWIEAWSKVLGQTMGTEQFAKLMGQSLDQFLVAQAPAKRAEELIERLPHQLRDRKSTRLNSSHLVISYAVFCLKKKNKK